jgi:hypothetical protein
MAGAILGALHGEAVIDVADLALLNRTNRIDLLAEADRFTGAVTDMLGQAARRAAQVRDHRAALLASLAADKVA